MSDALSYAELRSAAGAVACAGGGCVARGGVGDESSLETVRRGRGRAGGRRADRPDQPEGGDAELEHILGDSSPELIFGGADGIPVDAVRVAATGRRPSPDDEAPAIVVYTSGTTGPPKGVVLPRRAIASNLDALADAWDWTADDVVAHGLPLFHVHGLILGVLGPLRLGGGAWHLGRFSSEAAGAALAGRATMLFGVPTMYHRLAADLEASPALGCAPSVRRGCWCPAARRCRRRTMRGSPPRAGCCPSSATA